MDMFVYHVLRTYYSIVLKFDIYTIFYGNNLQMLANTTDIEVCTI